MTLACFGEVVVYSKSSRRVFCQNLLLSISTALAIPRADGQDSADTKSSKNSPEPKVYEPGGDVKPPKLVHYVEPDFSPKAKEAFVEGTVKISTVVTTEGVATGLRVISGLNAEEDHSAANAVKQWKFQPGTKSGQPVNVRVTVEVSFHLL